MKLEPSEIKTERQFEQFLRDAGFPKAFATAVARHGFKSAAGVQEPEGADASQIAEAIAGSFAEMARLLEG